jgi:hypothetical protein
MAGPIITTVNCGLMPLPRNALNSHRLAVFLKTEGKSGQLKIEPVISASQKRQSPAG